jgi:hypothetical protein
MTMGFLKRAVTAAALTAAGSTAFAADLVLLSEGFNSAALPTGWVGQNLSDEPAAQAWFKGFDNADHFPAQAGAGSSYLASSVYVGKTDANGDPTGAIDAVLYTPSLAMDTPTVLTFWTRTVAGSSFADSLYVGALVGGAESTLLAINEAGVGGAYPEGWTQYTVTLGAQGAGVKGQFYFDYYIPDAAVAGNYIGLDSVNVTAVPEPGSWLLMAGGVLMLSQLQRRRR